MHAKTTVCLGPTIKENKFWLNGNEVDFNRSHRVRRVIYAGVISIHYQSVDL